MLYVRIHSYMMGANHTITCSTHDMFKKKCFIVVPIKKPLVFCKSAKSHEWYSDQSNYPCDGSTDELLKYPIPGKIDSKFSS